jgi:hypothetical protein
MTGRLVIALFLQPLDRLRGAPQLAGHHAQPACQQVVLREHLGMDPRLPTAVRLVRVSAVAARQLLRPRDAQSAKPQLRLHRHNFVSTPVCDCNRSRFGLRHKRVKKMLINFPP